MIKEIKLIGEPVLKIKTKKVNQQDILSDKVQNIIQDLIDTMRNANGAGIAANQIGYDARIFCVEVKDNPRYPYKPNIPLTIIINPVITFLTDEEYDSFEGCLSVPNLRGKVKRKTKILINGFNEKAQAFEKEYSGLSAGTMQHEFDHLDGYLFIEKVFDPKSICTWDNFNKYYRDEFIQYATKLG